MQGRAQGRLTVHLAGDQVDQVLRCILAAVKKAPFREVGSVYGLRFTVAILGIGGPVWLHKTDAGWGTGQAHHAPRR